MGCQVVAMQDPVAVKASFAGKGKQRSIPASPSAATIARSDGIPSSPPASSPFGDSFCSDGTFMLSTLVAEVEEELAAADAAEAIRRTADARAGAPSSSECDDASSVQSTAADGVGGSVSISVRDVASAASVSMSGASSPRGQQFVFDHPRATDMISQ